MRLTVNCFGNEGAIMISEALKINCTLTKLNLQSDRKKGNEEGKKKCIR